MTKRRNTCCHISLGCLISGVLGTVFSVFMHFNYFSFFQIWDRAESEVFNTDNFFIILALFFIVVFNAGWIFLIPAGIRKESKPYLFTLIGIYLAMIIYVVYSLRFGFVIPF